MLHRARMWRCDVCTMEQRDTAWRCKACATPRPDILAANLAPWRPGSGSSGARGGKVVKSAPKRPRPAVISDSTCPACAGRHRPHTCGKIRNVPLAKPAASSDARKHSLPNSESVDLCHDDEPRVEGAQVRAHTQRTYRHACRHTRLLSSVHSTYAPPTPQPHPQQQHKKPAAIPDASWPLLRPGRSGPATSRGRR